MTIYSLTDRPSARNQVTENSDIHVKRFVCFIPIPISITQIGVTIYTLTDIQGLQNSKGKVLLGEVLTMRLGNHNVVGNRKEEDIYI